MSKKIVLGVVVGLAVASVMMSKNSKYNWRNVVSAAGDVIDGIKNRIGGSDLQNETESGSSRSGQYLARKAKQHAIHKFSQQAN